VANAYSLQRRVRHQGYLGKQPVLEQSLARNGVHCANRLDYIYRVQSFCYVRNCQDQNMGDWVYTGWCRKSKDVLVTNRNFLYWYGVGTRARETRSRRRSCSRRTTCLRYSRCSKPSRNWENKSRCGSWDCPPPKRACGWTCSKRTSKNGKANDVNSIYHRQRHRSRWCSPRRWNSSYSGTCRDYSQRYYRLLRFLLCRNFYPAKEKQDSTCKRSNCLIRGHPKSYLYVKLSRPSTPRRRRSKGPHYEF